MFLILICFSSFFDRQNVFSQNETDQHDKRIVFAETHMRADGVREPGLADGIREIPAVVDKVKLYFTDDKTWHA